MNDNIIGPVLDEFHVQKLNSIEHIVNNKELTDKSKLI